jgi:hypothetical protein
MGDTYNNYPPGLGPPVNGPPVLDPPVLDPFDIIKNNLDTIFVEPDDQNELQIILNKINKNLTVLNESTFLSATTFMNNINEILNKLSESGFTDKFVNVKLNKMTKEAEKMKRELIHLYLSQIHKVLQILINIEKIKEDISGEFDKNVFNYYLFITSSLISIVKMNLGTDKYVVKEDSNIKNWGILEKNLQSSEKIDWTNFKDTAEAESKNTLYNLLCLKQSLLDKDGKPIDKITFKKKTNKLTGEWSNDKDKIAIVSVETTQEAEKKPINLLITGFGPSAAGKSYIIGNILSNLLEKGENVVGPVPKITVQIDGEIFRENNVTYTILSLLAYVKGYLGFTNLDKSGASGAEIGRAVVSSFRRTLSRKKELSGKKLPSSIIKGALDDLSFLNTSELKDNFVDYLKKNIGGESSFLNGNFNVYLPNTLTSSTFTPKKWTWLNGQQPNINFIIYLMIFQCKEGCPYCKGTTVSGTERAAISGKAYSSSNYETSLKNGLTALQQNTNGLFRLMIHNSGGKDGGQNKIFLEEINFFLPNELTSLNLESAIYNFDNDAATTFNKKMSDFRFTARTSTKGGSQQKRTRRRLPRKTTNKKTHKKLRKTANKTQTSRKTSRKKRKNNTNNKKKTQKKEKNKTTTHQNKN